MCCDKQKTAISAFRLEFVSNTPALPFETEISGVTLICWTKTFIRVKHNMQITWTGSTERALQKSRKVFRIFCRVS